MKYRVFISTELDLKGQCKRFKVESDLDIYHLQSFVKKIAKSSYYVTVKEGWKGKGDVIPFNDMLCMAEDLRFYKRTFEKELVKSYKPNYKHVVLPSAIMLRRWRTESVPGYIDRTFYALTSVDPTLKPNIEGVIDKFKTDCNIIMHQSKTEHIIWTFDDITLLYDHEVDGRTDYYVYEANYEWITKETKIEL